MTLKQPKCNKLFLAQMSVLLVVFVAVANVEAFSSFSRHSTSRSLPTSRLRTAGSSFVISSTATLRSKTLLSASTAQESQPSSSSGTGGSPEFINFATLPRHESNEETNEILLKMEKIVQELYNDSHEASIGGNDRSRSDNTAVDPALDEDDESGKVYSNSYVDLGKVSSAKPHSPTQ